MNEILTILPGGALEFEQPHGFHLIAAVRVDNFSGAWLGIDGTQLWIPPYTRGYIAKLFPTISTITIRSYTLALGALLAIALGTTSTVVLYDTNEADGLLDSEGVSFINEQLTILQTNNLIIDTLPPIIVIPAPAAGHIRVFSISAVGIFYSNWPAEVWVNEIPLIGVIPPITTLELSPASPTAGVVIPEPGYDLQIGSNLSAVSNLLGSAFNVTELTIRYVVL